MKKLVVTILLIIGLSNLAIADEYSSNLLRVAGSDISFISQQQDLFSTHSSDCINNCCSHQCHFGHCSFVLSENGFSFVPESHAGEFFIGPNLKNIFLKSPYRPPIA